MDNLSDTLRIKRVTDQWVLNVHGTRDKKYSRIHEVLVGTWSNPIAQQNQYAHDYLRHFISNYLPSTVRRPRNANDKPSYNFPGPMAMQLNRRYLHKIQYHDYWITEKSDGVRAMMLSIFEREFPRWTRNGRAMSLNDTCALESLWYHSIQTQESKLRITLDDRREYEVDFQAGTLRNLEKEDLERLRRHKGWTFSYFFDRNFEFYLSWEEFVFVTRQTRERIDAQVKDGQIIFQDVVLLDGEIVYNLREKRYNYSIYDVALCTSEVPHPSGNGIMTQIFPYMNETMGKRIEVIRNGVSDPHHCFYMRIARTTPPRLQILPKRFYEKNKLDEVLGYIHKDPSGHSNMYLYKDYNYNDGLVFTPDSAHMYPFAPGTNQNLLKWKWPDRLSCDFKAIPVRDRGALDPCCYDLYFNNRDRDALYKQATLIIEDHILEQLKEYPRGAVLECFYKREEGAWYVELIRRDKTSGNGFLVITSTLENMMENITTETLKNVCMSTTNNVNSEKENEQLFEQFQREIISSDYAIHLRLCPNRKNHTVNVQYMVSNSLNGESEWPFFTTLLECIWDDALKADEVADKAFNEQDQRFLYVEAIFVPHLGKYKLLSFKGMPERCNATYLLSALENMVSVYLRLDEHKRPLEDNDRPLKRSKNE
jgi:hypothetical protein